jgi:hypothetical protein
VQQAQFRMLDMPWRVMWEGDMLTLSQTATYLLRSMLKKRPRRPRCSAPPAADVFLLLLRLGLLSSLRRG